MSARGRESEYAAPRASLERRLRSSPSPEARHKRGDYSADSEKWLEVRHRRRRESRQMDRGQGNSRKTRGSIDRPLSPPRNYFFHDQSRYSSPYARDFEHRGRSRSCYKAEADRQKRYQGSRTIYRSTSRLRFNHSVSGHHPYGWRSRSSNSGARRQQRRKAT
ncbi:hypothetical protein L195_g010175 [Trifolium pratense]|uniref:Uncharacterized protein n=1 Tax=Trifolium pratense TaxID=57577 RepID=A0A2K3NFS6_TRIPR|nr:hypothetical protein L195_g025189 [Trifolium pratense]PNY13519.1 hypothetical protein L195_g010175 [Trifolium pratense]